MWELFGKGDLSCMEKVAHRYGSGMDNETMSACMADLREIRADIEKRAASLKRLTKEARESVPDGKTTREVANKRHLGLYPKVIFLDEVQNLYTHEEFGKEAERLVLDIIKMGRAIGVILVQSTQRPDAGSLPKAISAQAGVRIGLRMMGWMESDMVLGTGMNAKGVTSAQFGVKDRGVAWLVGVQDQPVVAKAYYLSAMEAERLTSRARELRQAASLLTRLRQRRAGSRPGRQPALQPGQRRPPRPGGSWRHLDVVAGHRHQPGGAAPGALRRMDRGDARQGAQPARRDHRAAQPGPGRTGSGATCAEWRWSSSPSREVKRRAATRSTTACYP